jgi:positive regulator of sigma E activity
MLAAITKLIKVKTLVTLILTVVFAVLALTGKIEAEQFLTIFTVVIGFYFGTQYEKSDKEKTETEVQQ